MSLKIAILPGDDIGLEVVPECIKVMKAAAARERLDIDWRPLRWAMSPNPPRTSRPESARAPRYA